MTGNLKIAFNDIKAEDALKANTMVFLQKEIQKRSRRQNYVAFRRLAVAFASVLIVVFSSVYSYSLYFSPIAFVDVDVNPSIELTLNRFDRVINVHAYNRDGEMILENANINHKKYIDAIGVLIDVMLENGFAQEDSLISVTLQIDDTEREIRMLSNIENVVREHHGTAQIDAFTVGSHTRHTAHEFNLSPAKYLAIQGLIEVDPTATIDGCRGHSIREIKHLTETHSRGHHGGYVPGETEDNGNKDHHGCFENEGQAGIPDNLPKNHHKDNPADIGNQNELNVNPNTNHGNRRSPCRPLPKMRH